MVIDYREAETPSWMCLVAPPNLSVGGAISCTRAVIGRHIHRIASLCRFFCSIGPERRRRPPVALLHDLGRRPDDGRVSVICNPSRRGSSLHADRAELLELPGTTACDRSTRLDRPFHRGTGCGGPLAHTRPTKQGSMVATKSPAAIVFRGASIVGDLRKRAAMWAPIVGRAARRGPSAPPVACQRPVLLHRRRSIGAPTVALAR